MKNSKLMTQREEDLMEFLWTQKEPLTISEMAELIGEENGNQVTLFRIAKGLLKKGYLKIHGFTRNNTQYARKFVPALTKEEYAAILLSERGIKSTSLSRVFLAMLGSGKRKKINQEDGDKLIQELEDIIEQIRDQEE